MKWRLYQAHHIFMLIGLSVGLIMIFITPPFQVPDEVNHFYRAYQIADGHWRAEQHTQRLGGYIPRSLIQVTTPFLDLRWQMNRKTSHEIIKRQWVIPLNPDDKVFMDFPNTALYNPVSYLPQIVPIYVLKKLKLPPLLIFYGTRIFTLLIWIFFIGYLIKSLVSFKLLFTILALLPMSVYINMGISADVMTNLLAFLLLAFCLNKTFEESPIGKREIIVFYLFAILLASAKIVYLPLVFLFLLIPVSRFERTSFYWLSFGSILLLGFGTAYLWTRSIGDIYIPYDQYNLAFRNFLDLPKCANMQGQLNFILNNDFYVVEVFFNSLYRAFDMYYPGYIGTFGWLDTKMPDWLVHTTYGFLITVALTYSGRGKTFSWYQRSILIVTLLAVVAALLLSQLLSWECVGNDFIKTVQGRYFIPVFPLFFLAISRLIRVPVSATKILHRIILLYSVFLLSASCLIIHKRYYVEPEYEITEIVCDAEKREGGKLITNISDVLLDNADRRTDEFSRSGHYALKLSKEHPFGFTYRVRNGKYGDVIEVEVWRLGNSGSIVIAGDGGKAFYTGTNESRYGREGAWNKLSFQYTLESDMGSKEIGIYIFNKFEESYFDDMQIRIMKRKTAF